MTDQERSLKERLIERCRPSRGPYASWIEEFDAECWKFLSASHVYIIEIGDGISPEVRDDFPRGLWFYFSVGPCQAIYFPDDKSAGKWQTEKTRILGCTMFKILRCGQRLLYVEPLYDHKPTRLVTMVAFPLEPEDHLVLPESGLSLNEQKAWKQDLLDRFVRHGNLIPPADPDQTGLFDHP